MLSVQLFQYFKSIIVKPVGNIRVPPSEQLILAYPETVVRQQLMGAAASSRNNSFYVGNVFLIVVTITNR